MSRVILYCIPIIGLVVAGIDFSRIKPPTSEDENNFLIGVCGLQGISIGITMMILFGILKIHI